MGLGQKTQLFVQFKVNIEAFFDLPEFSRILADLTAILNNQPTLVAAFQAGMHLALDTELQASLMNQRSLEREQAEKLG